MGVLMTVLFALAYVACMLVYDRLLLPMALIYMNRIRPRLRFLRQQ